MTGNLKLVSDGLDLTHYYDLFTGENNVPEKRTAKTTRQTAAATPKASSGVESSGAEKEPDAVQLPFTNLTADVNIAQIYLREVTVSNLQAAAKVNGGHIVLNPFKLALNGAPVTAEVDLDLGVPGYKYDASFNMKAVPVAPLVNSFEPDRKGKIGGTLTAAAKVSGNGITGASLKKNLNGNFDIDSTNLNYAVGEVKQPVIKLIVNVVGSIPELIHNPLGTATGLLGDIVGLRHGSLTDELQKSPIDAITAKGVAGSGRVELQQAVVQSKAFRADANGTIQIQDILTNSPIQMPVTISLGESLAQRIGMGGSDTNAAYAKMPDFLLIGGTIGNPKPDKKKLMVLGTSAVTGIVKAIPGTGSAGNIIQGLGGLLGGSGQPANTNASGSTNAPPSKTGSLLNSLLEGNKPPGTNTTTNQPATNKSPVKGLLNEFLNPKKQ